MSITPSTWTVLQEPRDTTQLIAKLNQRLGQELYVEVEAIRAIVDSGGETAETITILPSITDASALTITQTWNTGGTTFKAINVAITDTASAAGSLLVSYSVGGTVVHSVGKAGNVLSVALTLTGATSLNRLFRTDTAIEIQGATGAGISLFQGLNPGTTTNESFVAFGAYDSAGVVQKTASISSKWASATASTGNGILRFNATKNGGTDDVSFRIYGGAGAEFFGSSDTTGPGAAILNVNGTLKGVNLSFTGVSAFGAPSNGAIGLGIRHTGITTGASQYMLLVDGTFDATATTSGDMISVSLRTTAAAMTMVAGAAVHITDASLGAGSAVTTQYGLLIDAQTKGSTNYAWYAATTTNASSLTQAGVLTVGAGITVTTGGLTVTGICQLGATGGVTQTIIGGTGYGANVASLRLNGLTTTGGANVGTLTNCPHTGNPGVWVPLNIAGTVFMFPGFATS